MECYIAYCGGHKNIFESVATFLIVQVVFLRVQYQSQPFSKSRFKIWQKITCWLKIILLECSSYFLHIAL